MSAIIKKEDITWDDLDASHRAYNSGAIAAREATINSIILLIQQDMLNSMKAISDANIAIRNYQTQLIKILRDAT